MYSITFLSNRAHACSLFSGSIFSLLFIDCLADTWESFLFLQSRLLHHKHWTEKHLFYQYSAEKSLAVKIQNNGSYLIYLIHVHALYRRKLTFFLKSEIKLYFYDLRQKLVFLSLKIALLLFPCF